jgi:hypothetical protein
MTNEFRDRSHLISCEHTAFGVADVSRVKAGFFGEPFLGEFAGLAVPANVQTEGGKDFITFRHDS